MSAPACWSSKEVRVAHAQIIPQEAPAEPESPFAQPKRTFRAENRPQEGGDDQRQRGIGSVDAAGGIGHRQECQKRRPASKHRCPLQIGPRPKGEFPVENLAIKDAPGVSRDIGRVFLFCIRLRKEIRVQIAFARIRQDHDHAFVRRHGCGDRCCRMGRRSGGNAGQDAVFPREPA